MTEQPNVQQIVAFLDDFLESRDFRDVSYNGLQVAGSKHIKKIVTACTASLEAIDTALELNADMLLVHHGLFWKGADPRLVGNYYQRVKTLIKGKINLVAYHLPLDAHFSHGNNAYLAQILGADKLDYVVPGDKTSIAMRAQLFEGLTVSEITAILCERLDTRVQVIGNISPDMMLDDLLICSGSGSSFLDNDKQPTYQALITGDVNEQTYHMAVETGTVVFVVGHHASEQVAINNLGALVAEKFGLEHHATHFSYERDLPSFTVESLDRADAADE